ncbi:MAG: HAD family hydrolase [Candidatus Paceibacterota bacterium]|jgi:phosphoglycolate phosphatase
MRNVIFDWSGVVKDAVKSQIWIVNRIFESYGVSEISQEEFRENWEQPYILFYKKYLPEGFEKEDQSKKYREAIFHKDCPKAPSFLGIVEVIHTFKEQGLFLAVVSSDLTETVSSEIKEYGLENVFDEIVTDVHDKYDAVCEIIKKNNLSLEDTFFVGDSNHEIDVAKKAGIKSIAVTWGFNSEQRLRDKNPDHVINSSKELMNLILK